MRSVLGRVLRFKGWPAVLLVLTVLAGMIHYSLLSLAAAVPLVAASMVSASATAGYGLAALCAVGLFGVANGLYHPPFVDAQIERLGVATLALAIALAQARAWRARNARLASITSVAEVAQQVLMPPPAPRVGPLYLAARYEAAANDAHIGGDLFDVQPVGAGARLLVGDVRGKGLGAVRLASTVVGAFRERAGERHDLTLLLADLGRAVRRDAQSAEDFVTAAVADFDPARRVLRLALAGHPAPLLVRRGALVALPTEGKHGAPLGLGIPVESDKVLELPLRVGDRLLFFTDGTSEARTTSGAYFPLASTAERAFAAGSLDLALAELQRALHAWTGGRLQDDAALLAVEFRPVRISRALVPDGVGANAPPVLLAPDRSAS